jgi:hypothetical protein
MVDRPQLDWSAAQVREGTLSLKVTGDPDDDWEQTFVRTLALLSGGGAWGSVSFKKGKVTVEEVQEGSEESLRFALDGAVQEANAHHAEDESDESDDASGEGDAASGANDTDRRMTDRFRDSSD